MFIKKLLLGLIASFAVSASFAQDRIYFEDGSSEEVKIKEVGTRTIIYKKWNNQEGPDFVTPKGDVVSIKFKNGDEQSFGRTRDIRAPQSSRGSANATYGKNILSLSPVQMTNTSAIGVGISYERVLSKNSILSFYLPIAYSFKNTNSDYFYAGGPYTNNKSTMLWVYPGLKIYPTGSNGMVRYAVGPSLAFGTGQRTYNTSVFDPNSNNTVYVPIERSVFVMGLVINNSLNIQPTPKLHIGLELGIGIPYYTDENNNLNNGTSYVNYYNSYSSTPLVQFNFNIGYRL